MKRGIVIALALMGCLVAGSRLCAQTPATGNGQKPAAEQKQGTPQSSPQGGSNPFPEDTSTVPVMPSKVSDIPAGTFGDADDTAASLPAVDADPVKSPDQAGEESGTVSSFESSSDVKAMDSLLPKPGDPEPGKGKKKDGGLDEMPTESPKQDISVGKYYLDNKNWKAALSRFQSALVLDPDEPDVYWGMAESQRHLGNYADARANYLKVIEYDPDSKHAKDAKKLLEEPEMAKAASGKPQ